MEIECRMQSVVLISEPEVLALSPARGFNMRHLLSRGEARTASTTSGSSATYLLTQF